MYTHCWKEKSVSLLNASGMAFLRILSEPFRLVLITVLSTLQYIISLCLIRLPGMYPGTCAQLLMYRLFMEKNLYPSVFHFVDDHGLEYGQRDLHKILVLCTEVCDVGPDPLGLFQERLCKLGLFYLHGCFRWLPPFHQRDFQCGGLVGSLEETAFVKHRQPVIVNEGNCIGHT